MFTVATVITTYNQAPYLRQAVDSVLSQARKADQVLVIDDGSTDQTAEVLDHLPSGIDIIRQTNMGTVFARNRGLNAAGTTHVTFLDADNWLLPGYLRWTMATWTIPHTKRLGLVYTPSRLVTPDGGRGYRHVRPWNPQELRRRNCIDNQAVYSKAALADIGGYHPDFNRIGHEDWDLMLRLADAGWIGRVCPAPVFCYRQILGSLNERSLSNNELVIDAIDRHHPRRSSKQPSPARLLAWKGQNVAQTALRKLDARSWTPNQQATSRR